MKKLLLLAIALISFTSCRKECVTCTELNSGVSDSFCGTPDEVEVFVSTLQSFPGQKWNCR